MTSRFSWLLAVPCRGADREGILLPMPRWEMEEAHYFGQHSGLLFCLSPQTLAQCILAKKPDTPFRKHQPHMRPDHVLNWAPRRQEWTRAAVGAAPEDGGALRLVCNHGEANMQSKSSRWSSFWVIREPPWSRVCTCHVPELSPTFPHFPPGSQ